MQKDKLEGILQDLYAWNPKLKIKEEELIKLIELMAETKPDTKFDESFAADLKKDLLSHRILLDDDEGLEENNFLFNFNHMSKKIYIGIGALAVCGLAVIAILINNQSPQQSLSLYPIENNNDQFVQAAPGAFGNLALLNSNESTNAMATQVGQRELMSNRAESGMTVSVAEPMMASGELMATAVAPTVGKMVAPDSASSAVSSPVMGLGGGSGGDMAIGRMVMPMRSYEYSYVGEPIELTETTGKVYRRLKGDGGLGGNFDSLLNNKTFGPLNLSSFSGLQTNSLFLNENKPFGYSVNIDLREENIYIGQNWSYWQSERDKCGGDVVCWESYRIKIQDIPNDASLISMTNKFLADKNINLINYDAPQVDNLWRANYEATSDKASYYIPEEMYVIYPLIVDGQKVYDQGGNLDGLRASVNLLHKKVSGVSNLTSHRYEVSEYSLETNVQKILDLALKGGNNYNFYYTDAPEKITLELGTPTKSLIRYWRYNNNISDELLIPALIFPINNRPADYYGTRFVVIPIVQEMLDETIKNSGGGYGGEIMPMLR